MTDKKTYSLEELELIANDIRQDIIKMLAMIGEMIMLHGFVIASRLILLRKRIFT